MELAGLEPATSLGAIPRGARSQSSRSRLAEASSVDLARWARGCSSAALPIYLQRPVVLRRTISAGFHDVRGREPTAT